MIGRESALNSIWRSSQKRPLVSSFAVYWMILTLGPLLAGASLALSSWLLSPHGLNMPEIHFLMEKVIRVFALLLSCLAFWTLFSVVPLFPAYQLIYGALAVIPMLFLRVY